VRDLCDIVSKNGVLLLNIGPKTRRHGVRPDRAVLEGIGRWLSTNGEAIYGATVVRRAEEGPTKTEEGQFTDARDTEFTARDIRFTARGGSLYAIVLKWPGDGQVTIESLAERDASHLPVLTASSGTWRSWATAAPFGAAMRRGCTSGAGDGHRLSGGGENRAGIRLWSGGDRKRRIGAASRPKKPPAVDKRPAPPVYSRTIHSDDKLQKGRQGHDGTG
jgi:hypothetical protein